MTMTPTRDELAAQFDERGFCDGDDYELADVVLPLLAERDAEIKGLEQRNDDLCDDLLERNQQIAKRDARIAELDESIADFQQLAVDRTAERDAALAAATGSAKLALAWRACADRLAAYIDCHEPHCGFCIGALAEYERLRS